MPSSLVKINVKILNYFLELVFVEPNWWGRYLGELNLDVVTSELQHFSIGLENIVRPARIIGLSLDAVV